MVPNTATNDIVQMHPVHSPSSPDAVSDMVPGCISDTDYSDSYDRSSMSEFEFFYDTDPIDLSDSTVSSAIPDAAHISDASDVSRFDSYQSILSEYLESIGYNGPYGPETSFGRVVFFADGPISNLNAGAPVSDSDTCNSSDKSASTPSAYSAWASHRILDANLGNNEHSHLEAGWNKSSPPLVTLDDVVPPCSIDSQWRHMASPAKATNTFSGTPLSSGLVSPASGLLTLSGIGSCGPISPGSGSSSVPFTPGLSAPSPRYPAAFISPLLLPGALPPAPEDIDCLSAPPSPAPSDLGCFSPRPSAPLQPLAFSPVPHRPSHPSPALMPSWGICMDVDPSHVSTAPGRTAQRWTRRHKMLKRRLELYQARQAGASLRRTRRASKGGRVVATEKATSEDSDAAWPPVSGGKCLRGPAPW